MKTTNEIDLSLAPPEVTVEPLDGGGLILRSPRSLDEHERSLSELLRHWATERPGRTFLAERDDRPGGDDWRQVSWGEALGAAEAIGQSLAERGLGPEKPVMILSGNSVDHALLMLGAHLAGVPVTPVSPAYSLMSSDHGKLHHIFGLVEPAMVFVEDPAPFAAALESLDLAGTVLVTKGEIPAGLTSTAATSTAFAELLKSKPGEALRRAEAKVGPESVAKYLFTSGSTDVPKGVVNTHGMLLANQQQIAQCWLFLADLDVVLLDWLPWNHTFGANHNFNLVLKHGGTLYIDGGKPTPGLIDTTVENLRRISPTIYFNVPAGFGQLLPFLEGDEALCESFFRRLQVIFYAGAALPQDLWQRLEKLSKRTLGRRVFMTSAWGSTETSPMATTVHFPIDRAGVIGLPPPGAEIKMVPAGSKLELRVKGPMVTPGYLGDPEQTKAAFDEEGFYKIGDAGRLADPDDPSRGIVFNGRVAEDFKLTSGTWVNVGKLRVEVLASSSPVLQDAVVTGHDRDTVGLLAWLDLTACRELLGDADASPEEIARHPRIRAHLRQGLATHNAAAGGSSRRIERLLLLSEPPSIDRGEITDKGYINQRAVLEERAGLVEALYGEPADVEVMLI